MKARWNARASERWQLIDAKQDRHLWAEHYDRELNEILRMQPEIAYTIARQVETQIQIKAGPAKSVKPEAYEAYLRGRSAWNQRDESWTTGEHCGI